MGDDPENHIMSIQSRRSFVASALAFPFVFSKVPAWASKLSQAYSVASPNGNLRFELENSNGPQLQYHITFKNMPVIERSNLGIAVTSSDSEHNSQSIESHVAGKTDTYRLRESFAPRGLHSLGLDRCNG